MSVKNKLLISRIVFVIFLIIVLASISYLVYKWWPFITKHSEWVVFFTLIFTVFCLCMTGFSMKEYKQKCDEEKKEKIGFTSK